LPPESDHPYARKDSAIAPASPSRPDQFCAVKRFAGTHDVIHIIGVRHSLQVWTTSIRNGESLDARREDLEAFESYLTATAEASQAGLLAEEMSEERIEVLGPCATSVAKDVATRLQVEHLFCDPDSNQRRAIGLLVGEELRDQALAVSQKTGREWTDVYAEEIRGQFSVREELWLQRLMEFHLDATSVIFICGADHVDSFRNRLVARGISCDIISRDWQEERQKRCPTTFD
jgi:hypothetical protein